MSVNNSFKLYFKNADYHMTSLLFSGFLLEILYSLKVDKIQF